MAMIESFFKDSCVIRRSLGTTDELGNEQFQTVLSSICSYQTLSSGGAYLRGNNFQSDSIIIMPYTRVLLKTNDLVVLITNNNAHIQGTIENYESVDWQGIQGTTIWLKDATNE